MTIRIKVQNLDSRENAVVVVKKQNLDGISRKIEDVILKGGEQTEEYVHSQQRLVVEEIRNG